MSMTFDCIMSDPEDGATAVLMIEADCFDQAAEVADIVTQPGRLWAGWVPFVTSFKTTR